MAGETIKPSEACGDDLDAEMEAPGGFAVSGMACAVVVYTNTDRRQVPLEFAVHGLE